ncbi:uncharacterized protein LOC132941992 [Metopolophium dirhodum]|uniref:uncharacterized protein LOC132941992 n=1 Tax=Metopolophium dirhodum TaxID=44670 RepID=UPI00298F5C77|nr:uncharacterized protein LOC132941992 [Metopolophium dirhodum]
MSVTCLNCTKKIIAYSCSTGNLLSHFKHEHPGLMTELKAYKIEKSTSNCVSKQSKPIQTQLSICRSTENSGFKRKCSKEKVTELVFNYIVEEIKPISTCEKPSFRALI